MRVIVKKEVELKTCPFCGKGYFQITSEKTYQEMFEKNKVGTIMIECTGCSCTKAYFGGGADYYLALAAAVNKWNMRERL